MKAHISKKITEAGGSFLCSTSNRTTSGFSASLEQWKTECKDWQCQKCAASLVKMEASLARKQAKAAS